MKNIYIMGIILIILIMSGCTDKSERKTTEWSNEIITYGVGYDEAVEIYGEVSEYLVMRVQSGTEIGLIRVDSIIPKHNGEPQYFIWTDTFGRKMVLINPHERSDENSDVFDESDISMPLSDFRKLWYNQGAITIIYSQVIEEWKN